MLAASIGRSRIQLAIADLGCSLLAEESLEVDQASGPQRGLPAVVDRLHEMLPGCGRPLADVRGVGVSVPGSVDPMRGAMVSSIVLPSWDGIELPPLFRRDRDVPVLVDKDVNVMALAEQRGPLRSVRDLLMVKASTGIGVGIVSGGALQRGSLSAAGELGHIPIGNGTGVVPVRPDRLPRGCRRRLGHRRGAPANWPRRAPRPRRRRHRREGRPRGPRHDP